MKHEEQIKELAELFMKTGKAHHTAFIETDGEDPDWAIWYGKYLEEPLSNILNTDLSAGEITERLISLDKKFTAEPSSSHWTEFYAAKLVVKYG